MAARPIRLYWFAKTANFGDGISPLIVAHVSGRPVEWAEPGEADLFALGSIMRNAARAYHDGAAHRPVIWGSGCMQPVGRGFMAHVDIAALRGPKTREVLHAPAVPFGDPGLLMPEVLGEEVRRGETIGIVPHYHQFADPVWAEVAAQVPGASIIDVRDPDPLAVVRRIAACRHVFSSSLHGLIVADAFGVPNTWMDPAGIHASPEFKFQDYAASIGREIGAPIAPLDVPAAAAGLTDTPLPYAAGLAALKPALTASFPARLCAGAD